MRASVRPFWPWRTKSPQIIFSTNKSNEVAGSNHLGGGEPVPVRPTELLRRMLREIACFKVLRTSDGRKMFSIAQRARSRANSLDSPLPPPSGSRMWRRRSGLCAAELILMRLCRYSGSANAKLWFSSANCSCLPREPFAIADSFPPATRSQYPGFKRRNSLSLIFTSGDESLCRTCGG